MAIFCICLTATGPAINWIGRAGKSQMCLLCPGSSANPDQSNHSCIYVFDLEGNTLRAYILDTTIRRFCITEKEGVLYGLTLEGELPIVKYELE